MIVLIWPEASAAGNIILNELPTSDLVTHNRRLSRRATINGGVAFDDLGLAQGDRSLRIDIKKDLDAEARLRLLWSMFSLYECVTPEGVFKGAIYSITDIGDGQLSIQFYVKEKLQ